jgi:3-oxoacyl-[acyl-carrier protein] reductase
MELPGQVAVVTGGSRGIGRGIALALAEAGSDLVINYRKDEKAAVDTVGRIKGMGRKTFAVQGDVSNFEAAQDLMKEAFRAFGRIDILVNSAGIASRGNFVEKTEVEEWNRVLSTNLNAAFFCSKAVLEYMHRNQKGNIINISSIAASILHAGHSPYAVSKAGLEALTKVLAKEEGPRGIRVNAIAPGIVKTDMGDRLMKAMGEEAVKARLKVTPLGRIAYPEDLGHLAVFLASDKAAYITGKVIHMDGGIL